MPPGVCPLGTWSARVPTSGQALPSLSRARVHGRRMEIFLKLHYSLFKEKLTVNGAGLGTGTLEHRQRLDFRAASRPPERSRKQHTGWAGFLWRGQGRASQAGQQPQSCPGPQAPPACLVPLMPGLFSGAPADSVPRPVPWPWRPGALASQGQETLFLRSSCCHPPGQQEGHSRRWPCRWPGMSGDVSSHPGPRGTNITSTVSPRPPDPGARPAPPEPCLMELRWLRSGWD